VSMSVFMSVSTKDQQNRSDGDTVYRILPIPPDNADSNVAKMLKLVLCSSLNDIPLK
jgi:hypothetical protein